MINEDVCAISITCSQKFSDIILKINILTKAFKFKNGKLSYLWPNYNDGKNFSVWRILKFKNHCWSFRLLSLPEK